MKHPFLYLVVLLTHCYSSQSFGKDRAAEFDQLPTVQEAELPKLSNKVEPFKGIIHLKGWQGHTFVKFPFIENGASLDIDPQGRIYVAESNRLRQGVPDLRAAIQMVREDFQSNTVEDRLEMYKRHASFFPDGWFTKNADRIIRLEDRDGNGAADHRTLFSNHFNQTEAGIGFSLLAERDGVYFTCIPALWKMTDSWRQPVLQFVFS